jgi:hypothetical protein
VEIAWQRRNGDVDAAMLSIPGTPVFEECFSAFAHGTVIQTPRGPVAIEDIMPGDKVETRDHGPQTVLWRGSMACRPASRTQDRGLTRIAADGLGAARPVRDLLLGPAARLLWRQPGAPTGGARSLALLPIASFRDGATVFSVSPPSAVQMYHLALPIHAAVFASGLELETYHPGVSLRSTLSQHRQLAQFLSLFPYIDQPGDFGPLAYPRHGGGHLDTAPAA